MRPMLNLQTRKIRGMKWLSVGLIMAAVVTAIWNMPYFTIPLAWVSGASGATYIVFSKLIEVVQGMVPTEPPKKPEKEKKGGEKG